MATNAISSLADPYADYRAGAAGRVPWDYGGQMASGLGLRTQSIADIRATDPGSEYIDYGATESGGSNAATYVPHAQGTSAYAFDDQNGIRWNVDEQGRIIPGTNVSLRGNEDFQRATLATIGLMGGAAAAGYGGGAAAGGGAAGGGAATTGAGLGAGGGGMWAQLGGAGGLAQLGSTVLQSYQASRAAGDMRDASQAAIDEQRRQYDQTRGDFAPYREAGVNALGQLQSELGRSVTPEEVMSDPGYAFGLQQGQQAIDRRIAAMGGRVSGQAIKAAGRFGTDYATSGYNAAYQRRQDRLNRIAALAGIGQTATGSSAAAGANASNAISGLISSQGDANAAGRVAQGNIWGNTINQFGALYGRGQQRPPGYGYGGQAGWSSDPNADPYYMGGG